MIIAQQIITIALCIFGTMLTRFLPFIIFSEKRKTPEFVNYVGRYLPPAVFGMLVIYCLKDVQFLRGNYGVPEIISILVTTILHIWKRNMLLSIASGTICYMVLIQLIF
ncbi:MAG: AzlD domain-containing protein [Solobacterium sp.]|uniref:branched-chain amino acid transporter permease n=1 Tax=Solobacterium sp. TaxID=2060878 RepID=UPI001CB381D3|nr:branched-chain amino acid transporter permease [Solobacterium sp.]MBF1089089.1 AzlD domain-containing protein [Solobacterium sp.]